MKLLIKVRRDAQRFWDVNTFVEHWTKSWRGHYISRLRYPTKHEDFFDDFMMCQKENFQRKLYHDYWEYKKAKYYKKYRKEQSK